MNEVKEARAKNSQNQSKEEIEDDITFLIEEIYHNTFFKPLCQYIDSLLNQGPFCKSI